MEQQQSGHGSIVQCSGTGSVEAELLMGSGRLEASLRSYGSRISGPLSKRADDSGLPFPRREVTPLLALHSRTARGIVGKPLLTLERSGCIVSSVNRTLRIKMLVMTRD